MARTSYRFTASRLAKITTVDNGRTVLLAGELDIESTTPKATVPIRRSAPNLSLSYPRDHAQSELVAEQTAHVEVRIDAAVLFSWLAARAVATKSGVSKLQEGMITGKVAARTNRSSPRVVEIPIPEGYEIDPTREQR